MRAARFASMRSATSSRSRGPRSACGARADGLARGHAADGRRYDGICGVLGGLEVVRALNDAGVETARPIDVVVWTHEEGSRFAPPMIASGVLAGVYSLDYGLSLAEAAGVALGGALAQIGHAGDAPVGGAPLPAACDRAV